MTWIIFDPGRAPGLRPPAFLTRGGHPGFATPAPAGSSRSATFLTRSEPPSSGARAPGLRPARVSDLGRAPGLLPARARRNLGRRDLLHAIPVAVNPRPLHSPHSELPGRGVLLAEPWLLRSAGAADRDLVAPCETSLRAATQRVPRGGPPAPAACRLPEAMRAGGNWLRRGGGSAMIRGTSAALGSPGAAGVTTAT